MKYSILLLAISCSLANQSCKDKEPAKITNTEELSAEMKAYFVDYEVGTKWIYQDTLDKNNYDTIELIYNKNLNVNNGNTLSKGFELYYKPKKSKDFKVRVGPGKDNSCYVKVDALVTATGAIIYEHINGKWSTGVTYFDSVVIQGNKYYSIINSKSSNSYQQDMSISKLKGIISFWKTSGPGVLENYYKLIKTIKP